MSAAEDSLAVRMHMTLRIPIELGLVDPEHPIDFRTTSAGGIWVSERFQCCGASFQYSDNGPTEASIVPVGPSSAHPMAGVRTPHLRLDDADDILWYAEAFGHSGCVPWVRYLRTLIHRPTNTPGPDVLLAAAIDRRRTAGITDPTKLAEIRHSISFNLAWNLNTLGEMAATLLDT